MPLKCPYCGRTNAQPKDKNIASDTMFFPVLGGDDRDLVFCIACRNVVSGPPVDGCLFVPSDERLAAELAAIQQTAKRIRDTEREVNEKADPKPHKSHGEGYHIREDGEIEFCVKKNRSDKFVMNMVKVTLEELGFANAHPIAGTSQLCRQQCPSKKGYEHVLVKVVAVTVEGVEDG